MRLTRTQLRRLVEIWIKPAIPGDEGDYAEKLAQLEPEQSDELASALGYEGEYTSDVEKYKGGGPLFESWLTPELISALRKVGGKDIEIVAKSMWPLYRVIDVQTGETLIGAMDQGKMVFKIRDKNPEGGYKGEELSAGYDRAWERLFTRITDLARSTRMSDGSVEILDVAEIHRAPGVIDIRNFHPAYGPTIKRAYDKGKLKFYLEGLKQGGYKSGVPDILVDGIPI